MVIKRIDVVEHLSRRGIVFEKDGVELGEASLNRPGFTGE